MRGLLALQAGQRAVRPVAGGRAGRVPGVTVNAVHPGSVATDIWSGAPWFARPFLAVAKRRMLSPAEGGRALTHLAVSPDVEGVTGEYFDRFAPRPPSELAQDDDLGLRLREETARLVGLPVSCRWLSRACNAVSSPSRALQRGKAT